MSKFSGTFAPASRIRSDGRGGYVIDTPAGSHIEVDSAGNCQADLPVISSVGLLNLCEVTEHRINRVLGSTSHVMQFGNGGYAHLAYTDQGELLTLEGFAVRIRCDEQGHVSVGACPPADTP